MASALPMAWIPKAAPSSTPTAAPVKEATRLACRSSAKLVETRFLIRLPSRHEEITQVTYFFRRAFLRAWRSRLRFLLRASLSAALSVEMGSGA